MQTFTSITEIYSRKEPWFRGQSFVHFSVSSLLLSGVFAGIYCPRHNWRVYSELNWDVYSVFILRQL